VSFRKVKPPGNKKQWLSYSWRIAWYGIKKWKVCVLVWACIKFRQCLVVDIARFFKTRLLNSWCDAIFKVPTWVVVDLTWLFLVTPPVVDDPRRFLIFTSVKLNWFTNTMSASQLGARRRLGLVCLGFSGRYWNNMSLFSTFHLHPESLYWTMVAKETHKCTPLVKFQELNIETR
jgi:hypothetical protein